MDIALRIDYDVVYITENGNSKRTSIKLNTPANVGDYIELSDYAVVVTAITHFLEGFTPELEAKLTDRR